MAFDWGVNETIWSLAAAGVTGGATAIGRWLKPLVKEFFAAIPRLEVTVKQNAATNQEIGISIKAICESMVQQSELLHVLARISSSAHIAGRRIQSVILLVEDSKVDERIVAALAFQFVRRFRLQFACVTTLDEAITQFASACVVILDVGLPDSGANGHELKAFVDMCPAPVIIHSVNEYTRKEFPNAHAIIRKACENHATLMTEAIESAILKQPFSKSSIIRGRKDSIHE
jgi:hypothetical protein